MSKPFSSLSALLSGKQVRSVPSSVDEKKDDCISDSLIKKDVEPKVDVEIVDLVDEIEEQKKVTCFEVIDSSEDDFTMDSTSNKDEACDSLLSEDNSNNETSNDLSNPDFDVQSPSFTFLSGNMYLDLKIAEIATSTSISRFPESIHYQLYDLEGNLETKSYVEQPPSNLPEIRM